MISRVYPENIVAYVKEKVCIKWDLEWNEVEGIENVIVVPAICEFKNIKNLLSSLVRNDSSILEKSLVIFVINNSVSSNNEIKEDNKKSLTFLKGILNKSHTDHSINKLIESGININITL